MRRQKFLVLEKNWIVSQKRKTDRMTKPAKGEEKGDRETRPKGR